MSSTTPGLWTTLRQTTAATTDAPADPRLQSQTYAIPFEEVWRSALALADGGLRGWSLIDSDDQEGIITAEARPLILPGINDVTVTIGLDADAQTCVNVRAASRDARLGLGTNHRHIARFMRTLHATLTKRRRTR